MKAATIAFLSVSTLFLMVILPVIALRNKDTPTEYCYFVIDERGNEYPSEFAPYFGDFGIYVDTDHGWAVITSPIAQRVDKDCLRRKGVDVPDSLGSGTE